MSREALPNHHTSLHTRVLMAKASSAPRVLPTGPSNQDAPHIGNQFEEDSFFQRVLQRLLPPAAWNPIADDLVRPPSATDLLTNVV